MRFHNIFLPVLLGLILLLFNLLVIMEVAYAMPPKSGDMIKFIENNPPIESPSTPFIGPSGQQVTLRDYKKTWTLINFWATWCAPCISELPSLSKLQEKLDNTKFKLLKLGLTGIPVTLLVSPTGEVVGKLVGTAKWDTRSAIDLVNFYLQK